MKMINRKREQLEHAHEDIALFLKSLIAGGEEEPVCSLKLNAFVNT